MQARFYDPIASRFLSTDPIGYQDQLNLYAYVHNDPVNGVDPTGEFRIGANVEGQLTVGGGGKFSVEVSVDFGTGEISADVTVGERVGLKGKGAAGVFLEPSSKRGNSASASLVAVVDASAELKTPLGSAEGSAEASLGAQQSTDNGQSGYVSNTDVTGAASLGPVSIDSTGRGTVAVGAGLGASAGQDANISASVSIPDTAKVVKGLFSRAPQKPIDKQ